MTCHSHSLIIPRPATILVVDDDPEVVSALRRMLSAAEPEWLVLTASNGQEALERMADQTVDVVITDLNMPVMDGFQLLTRLERAHSGTVRIVHSSHTATLATELLRYLAHNVVSKPTPAAEILELARWGVRAAGAVRRQEAVSA